jgi:membrane protein
MALFSAIFKILPNSPIQWRNVWVGAAFTTCLFIVGKFGIGWYLGKQATASAYGSAGSFAALLSWLYYTSMILLFGAEFTKTHTRFFGDRAKRVGGKSH